MRSLFARLFVIEPASVPAQSTPSPHLLLRHLASRHVRTRLQAMDAIAQNGTVSKPLLAALIRAIRDPRADVSRHAVDTLVALSRAGHNEEIVHAFSRAVRRSAAAPGPSATELIPTGYAFKVLDSAEEQRARDALNQRP